MKFYKKIILILVCFIILVLLLLLMNIIYAKYKTEVAGKASISISRWDIKVNDNSIKRLYFPTLVFVKEGKIVYVHIGTSDSQENPYIELTEDQKTELSNVISAYATKVYDVVCDEQC